jgi:hypothetical protein
MRFLTNLMVVASLVFLFIFLQDHYDITAHIWQYWSGAGPQAKGSATPVNPGVSALPADHDYQLVIDVSGKGPFMQVVHGPAAEEKKVTKKHKKAAAASHPTTKDQPQGTSPLQTAPQPQIAPPPQPTPQPQVTAPPQATSPPVTKSP